MTMPRVSIFLIRAALLYLAAGFTFGALLLFHKGVPLDQHLWQLLPAHIEFVLLGWLTQFAMGVAFWILPRYICGLPRGDDRPLWAVWGLLNAGVLLAGLGPLFELPPGLVLAGRLAELLAVAGFVSRVWLRVKALGQ